MKAQAKQKELAMEAEQSREDEEYGDGGIDDDMLVDFDLDV